MGNGCMEEKAREGTGSSRSWLYLNPCRKKEAYGIGAKVEAHVGGERDVSGTDVDG